MRHCLPGRARHYGVCEVAGQSPALPRWRRAYLLLSVVDVVVAALAPLFCACRRDNWEGILAAAERTSLLSVLLEVWKAKCPHTAGILLKLVAGRTLLTTLGGTTFVAANAPSSGSGHPLGKVYMRPTTAAKDGLHNSGSSAKRFFMSVISLGMNPTHARLDLKSGAGQLHQLITGGCRRASGLLPLPTTEDGHSSRLRNPSERSRHYHIQIVHRGLIWFLAEPPQAPAEQLPLFRKRARTHER